MSNIRKACVSGLLLLAATSVQAAVPCQLPPAGYDHEPTHPYRVVQFSGRLRGGIAVTDMSRSIIYLPRNVSARFRACLLRHEKGHVNGWDPHHSGARYQPY